MLRTLWLCFILFLTTGLLVLTSFAGTTFTDVTEEAGVGDEGSGSGVAVGDYDNDGDLDIYVSNGFFARLETNVLYHNNGDGTFTDVTWEAGVEATGQGFPTAFFDYDNDGLLDLYVVNWGQPDFLFHNEGNGIFTDVSKNAGIEVPNMGAGLAIFDYNNDGLLDIYVGNGDMAGGCKNDFYRNNGNGTFKYVAQDTQVEFSTGRDVAPVFCDYDNDGDMDLYLANGAGADVLFCNNDDGTFDDVTANVKIDFGVSWTAVWGDYDNDGDFDLYVMAPHGGPNGLYRNNGDGTFTELSKNAGIIPPNIGNSFPYAAFGDYDNDGYLDLYVTNCGDGRVGPPSPKPNIMYHNNGNGTFTDVTKKVGLDHLDNGTSPTFFDYDNDGDLDIYIPVWGGDNILYQNNGNDNHWLHIKTIGTESNRDGIGAKVKVVAGDLSMLRMVGVGSGNGQNSLPVEFGFGKNTQAELVEIRWPSGQVDTFNNVPANRMIVVKEGEVSYQYAYGEAVNPRGKKSLTWGKIKQNRLLQNYPNPFNPETWIPFQLAESANVVVSIYDVFGQLVREIELGRITAGNYISKDNAVRWDGRNSAGEKVSSGLYFYQIKAGDFSDTRRMLIVK